MTIAGAKINIAFKEEIMYAKKNDNGFIIK
jgi:hypothetical protein